MNASSINTQALLKSGGAGLGVTFLVIVLYTVVTVVGAGIGGSAGDTIASAGSFLGLCSCCLSVLAFAGVGALYGYFAGQSGTPVETGPMALGGGLAAVIVGFLTGICAGISGGISGASYASAFGDLAGSDAAGAAVGAGLVYAIILTCVFVILSAVAGAAGGAIYAATQGNKATPAAPPPAM